MAAAALLLASLAVPPRAATEGETTDLALILAIDCSFSVDAKEFALQMQGLGEALQDDEIWDAISHGPNQKIAIMVIQWSDSSNQLVVVPWTVLDSDSATKRLGAELATMPRKLAQGGTAISNALHFAQAQFADAPESLRRVIDVSTDGRNNMGLALPVVRDWVVGQGTTINVLAITNEFPELDRYAERRIAAGNAHFVIKANSYAAYGEAMLLKLIREITGPGMS